MKIDKDLVDRALEYITYRINIIDYLQSKNYLGDYLMQGSNKLFNCPFHSRPEKTPSLSVKEDDGFFKCFGQCQSSGNLIAFITKYEQVVLKKKTNYFLVLDKFVKSDKQLQLYLKSNTIFKESADLTQLTVQQLKKSVSFNLVTDARPNTFLSLSKYIQKKYPNNIDLYKSALNMMERGMSPQDIYDLINKNDNTQRVLQNSYADINLGDLV